VFFTKSLIDNPAQNFIQLGVEYEKLRKTKWRVPEYGMAFDAAY
jgi:hypothetical protein